MNWNSPLFSAILAGLLLVMTTSSGHALESKPVQSPRALVTLISSVDTLKPDTSFRLGLRFKLTSGWHIYWSNPGDAGEAPDLQAILPEGFHVSSIEWPTPLRIKEGPAMVFAYQDETTLPFMVEAPSTLQAKKIDVTVHANWLVCADKCIPEKGVFHLTLPVGPVKPSREAPLFTASATRLPQPSPFPVSLSREGVLRISDRSLSEDTIRDAWFFPDRWGPIDYAAPQRLAFDSRGLSLSLKAGPAFDPKQALSGILVLKDNEGIESYYSISTTQGEDFSFSDFRLLFLALLGGLILNLMPCVFPILAMKALSIAKLSGKERHFIRGQAVSYTLGVLSAFSILAIMLLVFRMAGKIVGWGFQFQSPIFVTLMVWLFFVLGLVLSGVYGIGARFAGIGQNYTQHKGFVGSFFTGLLAVIVATPCVAPFVGATMAAALVAPALEVWAIFLAMGLGLALPYVMLALFPNLARRLPRPGRWMEILKQALAFPMYGASVWLVWVLSQQAGPNGVVLALAGVVILGFLGWLFGQLDTAGKILRGSCLAVVILCILGLLYQIATLASVPTQGSPLVNTGEEQYSTRRLAELRSQGQPVFVDMTAAWCITCLINERVAISTEAVQTAFANNHIVYLKGDWTQQNPEITKFLQNHGSDGVPLYVFYPSGSTSAPVLLPQILTASIILDAINHPGI